MKEKEGFNKRSPLRNLHLNRLQFHKSPTRKCSNLSSSSHSASDASLTSSSSSSSSRVTNNVSVKSSSVTVKANPRSNEIEVPKKSFSEKSKKTHQPRYGNGTAQRSNLRLGKVTISKIGFEEDTKNSNGLSIESNSDCTERYTPVGKMADFMSFDFCKNVREDSISTTGNDDSAKTPPVEASVSPEIQRGSHSKTAGLKSSATPVCYGAGHLLSGVSDKRKRRRRGSLTGGSEKVNLFDDEHNNSQDSSIPLLVEASVRWRLSPCDEDSKMIHGNPSLAFDLMSSPSTFCGNESELGCENNNYSGSDSLLDDYEFKGFLAHSNKEIDSLLAVNPNSTSNCDTVSSGDGKYVRHNVIEDSSAFSLGSLSSGNIIQTPNSDSSSYGNVEWSKVDEQHKNAVQFEIDSITETLNAVAISPRSEMSDSIFPIQLQENVESVCSWVSDSTLEGLSLSPAKISWRDGLVWKVNENDEFDCTPDEQDDDAGCSGKQIMSYQRTQPGGDKENGLGVNSCLRSRLGIEFKENKDNATKMNLDASSPIRLDYDPCIFVRGKGELSEDRLNACAESICTNGSDLAASCDSDCT